MSIYLAWSVYKLVTALLGLAILLWFVYRHYEVVLRVCTGIKGRKASGKKVLTVYGVGAIVILLAAFNIGDRQQELERSRFDTPAPTVLQEQIKKQQRTIESVNKSFEEAVKETREDQ